MFLSAPKAVDGEGGKTNDEKGNVVQVCDE